MVMIMKDNDNDNNNDGDDNDDNEKKWKIMIFETQVSGDGPRFLTDSDTKTVTVAGGNHDNYHIG